MTYRGAANGTPGMCLPFDQQYSAFPLARHLMQILFIADPLESFQIYKDTTFAMMREAQKRGHTLAVCGPQDIRWQKGEAVTAFVRDITLTG